MRQLADVWVCAEKVELIRADQIISVYVSETTSDDGKFDYGPIRPAGLDEAELLLCGEVAGGRDGAASRRVILLRCSGADVMRLMRELTEQLAAAGSAPGDVGKSSYVFPRVQSTARMISWELGEKLPDPWPNIPRDQAGHRAYRQSQHGRR
jgi:hypothetical protein